MRKASHGISIGLLSFWHEEEAVMPFDLLFYELLKRTALTRKEKGRGVYSHVAKLHV